MHGKSGRSSCLLEWTNIMLTEFQTFDTKHNRNLYTNQVLSNSSAWEVHPTGILKANVDNKDVEVA